MMERMETLIGELDEKEGKIDVAENSASSASWRERMCESGRI